MDAACLVFEAHGKTLRYISAELDEHFQGLTQAAHSLRRRQLVSAGLSKRLIQLDNAFSILRHISVVSNKRLAVEITEALKEARRWNVPAVSATGSEEDTEAPASGTCDFAVDTSDACSSSAFYIGETMVSQGVQAMGHSLVSEAATQTAAEVDEKSFVACGVQTNVSKGFVAEVAVQAAKQQVDAQCDTMHYRWSYQGFTTEEVDEVCLTSMKEAARVTRACDLQVGDYVRLPRRMASKNDIWLDENSVCKVLRVDEGSTLLRAMEMHPSPPFDHWVDDEDFWCYRAEEHGAPDGNRVVPAACSNDPGEDGRKKRKNKQKNAQ
eukprot:TRINITY_DN37714_c0_g1_i1.p1 TRINITY_DN37714_c0_g1~~TRINITY_DN37714_c0_g1_i1.p1  ORF type:complete len:324 (+),score=60.34 TRINITY_DN37714_c0_g1_i1:107-1078(+)